jgi:hypothetical protein
MTETGFGEFHNGGTAEMPVADPPKRRRARNSATPDPDTGDANYRGQWQARNDDGKLAVTSSELAALKFACPPDRVKPYKHGDPIEV